jgi:hypothetical protein
MTGAIKKGGEEDRQSQLISIYYGHEGHKSITAGGLKM